jgi:isoleucyl-tRNA synthetase
VTEAIRKQARAATGAYPGTRVLADNRTNAGRTNGGAAMRDVPGPTVGLAVRMHAAEAEPVDLAGIERETLERWEQAAVPSRSVARTPQGPLWSFHQHPRVASGMPGVHQLPGLAIADMYQRLKAMQGFNVQRSRTWGRDGRTAEAAVQAELGLRGGAEIEAYGPERFVARCRETALRHADAVSAVAVRLGCWADNDPVSRASDVRSIELVWSSIRRIFDAGLLGRDHRVVPYCPRCRTSLAIHDLCWPAARNHEAGTALIVRLRVAALPAGANPRLRGADLLVEATAPWTLAANAAVAVHPHLTYALARRADHDDQVVVAESRLPDVLGDGWRVALRLPGAELAGASYLPPPFDGGQPDDSRPVIPSYSVPARTGTGLMHLAPAYSEDHMAVCVAHGVVVTDPLGEDGRFPDGMPLVGGAFFAEAEPLLIELLADRGVLFAACGREHGHPHPSCERCGTQVLFRAMSGWRLRVTALEDRAAARSETIGLDPSGHADAADMTKLSDLKRRGLQSDWLISRSGYWGTPLPIWECPRGHVTCPGSLSELSELAGRDVTGVDPHRPFIDAVTITCPRCGAMGGRVPEVIDDWYDAGSLMFAALDGTGTQTATTAESSITGRQPTHVLADIADEGGEWLSCMLVASTLATGHPGFWTVLRLEPMLDHRGRPMSRGLGNLVPPLPLIERYGADTARWYFAASAPTGAARTMTDEALLNISATVLLRYWKTADFLVRSAADGTRIGDVPDLGDGGTPPPSTRPLLDRWMLSELQFLVRDVTNALATFDSPVAAARIAEFVGHLCGRYLAHCRVRLSCGGNAEARRAVLATLHECLVVLTRLMAPITPFVTDHVWSLIRSLRPGEPDSVHLAAWPVPEPGLMDDQVGGHVALADRLGELGRSARAAAGIGIRRPLPRAMVAADGMTALRDDLGAHLAHELDVESVEAIESAAGQPRRVDGWVVAAEGTDVVALDTGPTPEPHAQPSDQGWAAP